MNDKELMEKYERVKDFSIRLGFYECEEYIDLEHIIRIAIIKLKEN